MPKRKPTSQRVCHATKTDETLFFRDNGLMIDVFEQEGVRFSPEQKAQIEKCSSITTIVREQIGQRAEWRRNTKQSPKDKNLN